MQGGAKLKKMAHLITVPTFTFHQGDDYPLTVSYYNDSIELFQGNESIAINPNFVKDLFKEITKHQKKAEEWLKQR